MLAKSLADRVNKILEYIVPRDNREREMVEVITELYRLQRTEILLPICKKLLVDFETVYNDRARLLKDCAFIKEKPFKDWPDVSAAFEAVKRIEEGTE